MDSSAAPPHHQSPLQRHPQQHHHHPPQNFMVGPPSQSHHVQSQGTAPSQHPNSYSFQSQSVASNNLMAHHQHQQHQQQGNRFPFNSMVTSSGPHQTKMPMDYPDGGGGGAGGTTSPTGGGSGFSIESAKKKRGRPRKYSPDGAGSSIALGLSPTPAPVAASMDSGGAGADTLSSENPSKKHRGRPSGSGKKQLDALGTPGVGFTPHVIIVKAGEDIASKIMAFSQQGPRTVCILSANGGIANVTLQQPTASDGTVNYEGRFEIITLSGSLGSENDGTQNGPVGLSVSLAGTDGRVLGGGVVGTLIAASTVQIIVGSFIQDGKKQKNVPAVAPAPNMLSFVNNNDSNNARGMGTGGSPPSQGGGGGSSGGDGGGSSDDDNGSPPMNQGTYVNNNAGGGGQSMPPMYTSMGWANSTMKMHQHHHHHHRHQN